MSVWFAIPSARPNGGTIPLWRERGYKIAVVRDEAQALPYDVDIFESFLPYPGYAVSVNWLVQYILKADPQAEWIVTGGDDVEPDKNHTPEEIARECSKHFRDYHSRRVSLRSDQVDGNMDTFGVMQPTGDRWANGSIDRICGSPWIGRAFCERMYGGNGPLFHGYRHMHVDEELFEVSRMLGVLWQRPDLIHLHQHWMRATWPRPAKLADCPDFLKEANSTRHWNESKALFQSRQRAGFPGHEPLPVEVCV